MDNNENAVGSSALDPVRDELTEAGAGRSPATPFWAILGVSLAVGGLFALAVTLVAIAYLAA